MAKPATEAEVEWRFHDDGSTSLVIEKFGREIDLRIGDEIDEYGQFLVSLLIDGKERHTASYTDKR